MNRNIVPICIFAVVLVVSASAQEMAREQQLDASKQAAGLALLKDFRAQWAQIQQTYATNPPAEYAADPLFKTRLQDIANAADDMENAFAASQPRRSMLACGFGCGLFVSLHKENGLSYTLDKLFHLRRASRVAASVFRTRSLGDVRPQITTLLQLRDDVLLAPLPWLEGDPRNQDYEGGCAPYPKPWINWRCLPPPGGVRKWERS